MTGAASTSIHISYSTEDGIATEEFIGFGGSDFLAEVEDVEEYPITYEPAQLIKACVVQNGSKCIKGPIGYELKMVTLITDKDSDGVRIIRPDEQETINLQHSQSTLQSTDAQLITNIDLEKFISRSEPKVTKKMSFGSASGSVAKLNETEKENDVAAAVEVNKDDCGGVTTAKYLRESMEICSREILQRREIPEEITLDCGMQEDRYSEVPEAGDEVQDLLNDNKEPAAVENSLDLSKALHDEPPVLSPNYDNGIDSMESIYNFDVSICGNEEHPPPLTEELPSSSKTILDGRRASSSFLKRKRNSKPSKKSKSSIKSTRGKSLAKARKVSQALHKKSSHVVIPHSSAEIQERVKNRQRKTTQSYGSSLPVDIISELESEQKLLSKTKPSKRKLSSESSCSDPKKSKSQNVLYIVEKILKKGMVNGRPHFFVKWLSYPNSMNTWEPEENFSLDLVSGYEKSLAETGETPVIEEVTLKQSRSHVKLLGLPTPKIKKEKCPGCLSFPVTFIDNRIGPNGFDQGLTYHKIYESFVLDDERCALVEFDEKYCLELISLSIINERLKSEIQLH